MMRRRITRRSKRSVSRSWRKKRDVEWDGEQEMEEKER